MVAGGRLGTGGWGDWWMGLGCVIGVVGCLWLGVRVVRRPHHAMLCGVTCKCCFGNKFYRHTIHYKYLVAKQLSVVLCM